MYLYPPENSVYSNPLAFSELEQEFLNISVNNKYILLTGDFNSRTGTDPDFFDVSSSLYDNSSDIPDFSRQLKQFNLSRNRCSKDVCKNSYGYFLLDMCKGNNLFILNGRVTGDKEGIFTCKQSSVVDYFICTYDLLKYVNNMHVLDFSALYSDVHCPVELSLVFENNPELCINETRGEENTCEIKKIKKWDSEKEKDYLDTINRNKVDNIVRELDMLNSSVLSQESINKLVESATTIMLKSAEEVFGVYTCKNNQRKHVKKEDKPWFDKKCKETRKCYRVAKRRYRFTKSNSKREEMKRKEREYKRQMDTSIREHRKNFRKKMNNLKSNNPKEYWKILNAKRGRKKTNIHINTLFDFFKNLNSSDAHENNDITFDHAQESNNILNCPISEEEIYKCIQSLQNNKACGDDCIANEYIKSTCQIFMPIYVRLFNIIFDSGNVPDVWLTGNIIPFYKNKGNQCDPQNYRPITILSCMGKLFTSILNARLCSYLEEYFLLNENQFGFRKGYSTVDSIFVLHMLFELLKKKKKKFFCAFIDFAKAFDTVWRSGLWTKLLQYSVNGKMYNIIVNMYSNIKSRIFHENQFSDYFPCNVGVRQGENLSPVLFALYLNDLENFMQDKNVHGLDSISDDIENELNMYLKLFVILYADDTVLMSESSKYKNS